MPGNLAYKPDGYASVAVYMMADEAHRVIKFVKATFSCGILRKKDPGRTAGSCMRNCGSTILFRSCRTAPTNTRPFPLWLHVYVPDVDAAYARALEAGGVSIQAPAQKDDEDRRSGVRDPAGNIWWISTRVG